MLNNKASRVKESDILGLCTFTTTISPVFKRAAKLEITIKALLDYHIDIICKKCKYVAIISKVL